jgi:hypothetical protein
MALGFTHPLTEMSMRNLPGGKGQPVHKADNLTALCESVAWKSGNLDVSQPRGPPWPVTGIALPFIYIGTTVPFTWAGLFHSSSQHRERNYRNN